MDKKYLVFIGIGFELVAIILTCIFIGQKLDEKYHGKGMFLIGFSVLGLTGWLIHVLKMLRHFEKDDQ
jgi:F0F1-type ATP synthase assembly protein I